MTARDTSDMGQSQSQTNPETPLVSDPRNRRRRGLKRRQPSSASSGDANEASHVSEFCPTQDDVHALRYIFVQLGLPAELIFHILDEAAYYPALYASLIKLAQDAPGRPVKVSARECVANKHCAARLCMVSLPMPHGTPGETWRAKAVIWDIQSHDQGWGGDHPGTYRGAYSWFDACIFRPAVADIDDETKTELTNRRSSDSTYSPRFGPSLTPSTSGLFDNIYCDPKDVSPRLATLGYTLVTHGAGEASSPTWLVQRNLVGCGNFQEHHVAWGEWNASAADAEQLQQNGGGLDDGFVAALRPGDVVALWMRALYPGWANFCKHASVKIMYDVY